VRERRVWAKERPLSPTGFDVPPGAVTGPLRVALVLGNNLQALCNRITPHALVDPVQGVACPVIGPRRLCGESNQPGRCRIVQVAIGSGLFQEWHELPKVLRLRHRSTITPRVPLASGPSRTPATAVVLALRARVSKLGFYFGLNGADHPLAFVDFK
jgi:hypothetical protein